MNRTVPEDNACIPLQLSSTQQARVARAAAIRKMDAARFITEAALREANAVVAQAETVRVSVRDFTRIVELLKSPPAPNARLKPAIAALPDTL
ncbi:MAG TPA: DUF1778 domain-containing protein [Devosia sp.]|nr:DUF1778 domain-containing protein [Devosia sp.]